MRRPRSTSGGTVLGCAGVTSSPRWSPTRTPPRCSARPPQGRPRTRTSCTARRGAASAPPRAPSPPSCSRAAPPDPPARARASSTARTPTSRGSRPSGAHEMLRRDVDEAVVAAAARTPFEAALPRVRARARRHDERRGRQRAAQDARGAGGLRRPAAADRPARRRCCRRSPRAASPSASTRPRRPSSPPGWRRAAPAPEQAARRRAALARRRRAGARARPRRRRRAARPRRGVRARAAARPRPAPSARGSPLLEAAAQRGAAARAAHEERLAEELQFLPRKEHKRRETEIGEQARRADRRAQTAALDHGLQLAGLWYRDLACVAAGAPELAHHADRAGRAGRGRRGAQPRGAPRRPPSWSTTRAPGSRST